MANADFYLYIKKYKVILGMFQFDAYKDKFQYVILEGKNTDCVEASYYYKIFDYWYQQWSQLYKSLDLKKELSEEDFYNFSEVSALFFEDRVIGLVFYDCYNLAHKLHQKSKYLKNFPVEKIIPLLASTKVLSLSNLMVDIHFRPRMHLSEIMIIFSILRMKTSTFDNALFYTRNKKRVNDMAYKLGGIPLLQNIQINNENSDVAIFNKNLTTKFYQSEYFDFAKYLWMHRVHKINSHIGYNELTENNFNKGERNEQNNNGQSSLQYNVNGN